MKFIKIGSAVLYVTLDIGAIAEIDKQTSGTVTVSAKKITKLSDAAKKLIGNRPVFDITVSYQKNGKTEYVSNFGKGTVTLGIAYKAPSPAFTDTAKHWAKDNIDFVASRDLISGTGAKTFAPDTAITRPEAATILRRFVELVIDEGTARGWVQNDAGQWQYIGENDKPRKTK